MRRKDTNSVIDSARVSANQQTLNTHESVIKDTDSVQV